MKVGLGLPLTSPQNMLEWARAADMTAMSTIGFGDRLTYHNAEMLIMLAAAAAVTERIRIQTELLILPLRNTAWAAKQLATLDQLSQGRLTVGIGAGSRPDDFDAAGADLAGRGRRLDRQLDELTRWWRGEAGQPGCTPVGPLPLQPGGPQLLLGGFSKAAVARLSRVGDGFITAVPTVGLAAQQFDAVRQAWRDGDRAGRPRLVGQLNLALGNSDDLREARETIGRYYAFFPEPQPIVDTMLTTEDQVKAAIDEFREIGADELIFYCWSTSVLTVQLLGDIVEDGST